MAAFVVALALATIAALRPATFDGLARAWRPWGAAISGVVAYVLASIVYLTVLGPIALVRRAAERPWLTRRAPDRETYWERWTAPRGGPDRMF
jgi:hypothetical protein